LKAMDETDKPSKDAGGLISEAIELLAETSSSAETKERTMNTMHQTMDGGNAEVQDVTKRRVKKQRHTSEQTRTDFDTETSPIDSTKSMSPEQSFWFKLAGSDTDVGK